MIYLFFKRNSNEKLKKKKYQTFIQTRKGNNKRNTGKKFYEIKKQTLACALYQITQICKELCKVYDLHAKGMFKIRKKMK